MGNTSFLETSILGHVVHRVDELLPDSWDAELISDPRPTASDAQVVLRGPAGVGVTFGIEARRAGALPLPRLVASLREREQELGLPIVLVSDYLGPVTRRTLAEAGLSYADATGWVRLVSENPLILLTGDGAERSPRAGEPAALVRMNGVASGRVIRTLAAAEVPTGVRALATLAQASPGSVSKLLATLAVEGVIDRDAGGAVTAVRRRALVRRWAQDYRYATTNTGVGYWLAPRGLERALDRLDGQEGVTITGSAAARRMLPPDATSVVPLRLLALYAPSPRSLAQQLGLVEADPSTANVVIAAPQDPRILPGPGDPVDLAPPALVLADLLTLPGRSDAEAEQLMDDMASSDPSWKE